MLQVAFWYVLAKTGAVESMYLLVNDVMASLHGSKGEQSYGPLARAAL